MKKYLLPSLAALALAANANAATLTANSTGTFNWNDAGVWSGSTWNSVTPDDGVINSSAGRTITVDGATTAGTLTANQTSNTLTLGNSGTLTINTSLLKQGAGTLRVDGPLAGAFSTTISGGVLELRSNAGAGRVGDTTVQNGATLRVSNTNTALGTGTVNLEGGSTFAYGVSGSGVTLSNNVTVSGDINLANTRNSGSASFTIGTTGVNTFNLGGATRAISATATNLGDIINIQSAISNGGINLSGNATVRFGGSSTTNTYTGMTTLGSGFTGQLQLSTGNTTTGVGSTAIAGDVTINAGTLMLRNNDQIANTSTVAMTGGTFRLQDEGSNNRTDTVAALVFNGGTFAGGGGLALGGTAANGTLSVNSGGILSGNGTGLNIASTVLNAGGQIRPGSSGDSNAGTLGISSSSGLTWNGEASSVAQMRFNLGPSSDQIALIGALTKGTGSFFVFDFLGFNATTAADYTLMTFASQTGFSVGNFTATGITFDSGLSGQFALNSGNLVYSVIPEPTAWALLAAGLTVVTIFRRRKNS